MLSKLFSKRTQVVVFVLLLLGTSSLYYNTSVTVNARIAALESNFPNEVSLETLLSLETNFPEHLEGETEIRHQEVALLFDRSIPQSPEIPEALSQLAEHARAAGIRGMSITTDTHRSAELLGAEMPLFLWPIHLRFQSEYAQLAQFVHALQGMGRLTEVMKVSMRREPPGLASELRLAVYSQTAPPLPKNKRKKKKRRDTGEMFEEDEDYGGMSEDESGMQEYEADEANEVNDDDEDVMTEEM